MLYREFKNFKDLDLHVFDLYNISDIYKKQTDRNLVEPLKGIVYINPDKGLKLVIVGDKYEELRENIFAIGNEDNFENINFIPNNKLKYEKTIADLKEKYYQDKEVLQTRQISLIDHLRHPDYPDDVETMIPLEDGRMEQVWVRLQKVLDSKTFVGLLLHDSSDVPSLKKGSIVKLIYYDEPKLQTLILDSFYQ